MEKRLGVLESYMAVCTEGNYLRSEVFFRKYRQQFSRRSLQVFYTKDQVKQVMSHQLSTVVAVTCAYSDNNNKNKKTKTTKTTQTTTTTSVFVDGYSSGKRLL